MLVINNLQKIYGNKIALNNFSTTINKGEIVGLVGKNGAGKSTLLNCITENIQKTSGEILYNGVEITKNSNILKKFGILITANFLSYLKAYENLKLLCYASGLKDIKKINEKIDEVLNIVALKKEKYSYVHTFSFGMKQRLGLAQALLNAEDVLILDEPLVGLDALGKEVVKKVIRYKAKQGVAILLSDHNLNEVEDISDRIVCIDKGEKIFDGKFCPKSQYYIHTQDENLKEKIGTIFDDKIKIENKKIIIYNKDDINSVLNFLCKNNIFIEDIIVLEDSLKRFFYERDEH